MNQAISYNQLQNNLEVTCHQVCISHTPIFVEKENGDDFFISQRKLSFSDRNRLFIKIACQCPVIAGLFKSSL